MSPPRSLVAAATVAIVLCGALPASSRAQGAPAGSSPTVASPAPPAAFDYRLVPQQIAAGVYVLVGHLEDFSPQNGGNIVNTGFIVGTSGVIVIDTGPSKRYGEQLRAAIARVTPLPVVLTINTHHHPDHFLGNQAFPSETLAALPEVIAGIAAEGNAFNDNMYRLNGDWMRDTEVVVPRLTLTPGRLSIAGRDLEVLALGGHTAADLVLIDHASATVFASDLVFHERAPTTPHADLARWRTSLDTLGALQAKRWVPGHGKVSADTTPITETRAYLGWLSETIKRSAESGADMAEALTRPLPAEIRPWALAESEYRRSVIHLFPAAERTALAPASGTRP